MKKILPILISSLLCFSCASNKTAELKTFNGMVYDKANEPVNGAVILINGKEAGRTDMQGHFYIDNLQINTTYELTIQKPSYETKSLSFNYENITQVAYFTLFSANQLLEDAEKCINNKNYNLALDYISRSESCSEATLSSKYLRAITYYKQKKIKQAETILLELLSDGNTESYIYLFLADIYQYEYKQIDKAKEYLTLFLKNTYNLDIEKRLNQL